MTRLLTRRHAVGLLAGAAAMAYLDGCAQESAEQPAQGTPEPETQAESTVPTTPNAGHILTIYFSMPETDDPNDMTADEANSTVVIDGTVLGNVQFMAQTIQDAVGGDIFRIETVEPYPTDHDTLIQTAVTQQEAGERPELKGSIDVAEYDTIFFGHPIWNADLPAAVYSFLERNDMAGKTIIPFVCHGGSGFAGTPTTIQELQPDADVRTSDGYAVSRDTVADEGDEIAAWAVGLAGSSAKSAAGSTTLIAYFSHEGHTKKVARGIRKRTGGTLFRIRPEEAYPEGMEGAASVAEDEAAENARPAIAGMPENLAGYSTVFLGFPIWYGTAPMVIGTFLESGDFAGKEIHCFCTSSGSTIEEGALDFVRECAPDANVGAGCTANDDATLDA